jgi:hypothetical protein
MRRENGRVLIDISEHEYVCLLFMLGYALGCNSRPDWWRLVNSINDGNPDYIPYAIPEKASS